MEGTEYLEKNDSESGKNTLENITTIGFRISRFKKYWGFAINYFCNNYKRIKASY
jgi:hypothetical protein